MAGQSGGQGRGLEAPAPGRRDQVAASGKTGALEARGEGARLAIRWGSCEAWLGRAPTALPAWAAGYEVLPDERTAQAACDRTTLKHLHDAIERSPMQRMINGPSLAQAIENVRESLMAGISVRWLDVCEVEIVMGEVAEEFGGEDPLKQVLRTVLKKSRKSWSSCLHQSSLSGGSLCCPNPPRKGSNS
jgi:hypothetical protein